MANRLVKKFRQALCKHDYEIFENVDEVVFLFVTIRKISLHKCRKCGKRVIYPTGEWELLSLFALREKINDGKLKEII